MILRVDNVDLYMLQYLLLFSSKHIIQYIMNKNIAPTNRWENYQSARPGGSLIHNYHYHQTGFLSKPPKFRLQEIHRQQQQASSRQASDAELRSFNNRPINSGSTVDETQKTPLQRNFNWDKIVNLKKSSPKDIQNQFGYFKSRNSGGRTNSRLAGKESSMGNSPELLSHKSQKALPSFLRMQTKSPQRVKLNGKTLCRENFKVIKRLGQGKFGTVNLAKQINTGMIVALKVMQKRKIIQDNLLVQFIRELKIQSFLDHPNIVKTYGYFADQEYFYTVLQLGCDGQLYDIICSGQKLSEESTSFIIGNLLDSISLMHKHKILHRDIKPQNIVLVHGNVKLCDFGWAVNKKEQLRSTFCGTPLYLSPQLLQGERYDEKVDLWAIGVLAFELVYGVSPFNISQHEDLVKIITDEIQFPSYRKVSKQFKDFITAILKKNPKERLPCKDLLAMDFIRKYRDLQTCEELCQ